MTGTISTQPRNSLGSISAARRIAAWIETYSQPWIPAMIVSSGPSLRPTMVV